jgi:hypothetical protein
VIPIKKCHPKRHWCSTGRRFWAKLTGHAGEAPARRVLLGARRADVLDVNEDYGLQTEAVYYISDHLTDAENWRLLRALPMTPADTRSDALVRLTLSLPLKDYRQLWSRVIRPNPFAPKSI